MGVNWRAVTRAIEELNCPDCGAPFGARAVEKRALHQDRVVVTLACERCRTLCLAVLEPRLPAERPLDTDDVLDAHEFLHSTREPIGRLLRAKRATASARSQRRTSKA